jgi:hypothetical protein
MLPLCEPGDRAMWIVMYVARRLVEAAYQGRSLQVC